ncbi:hypothetical protein [Escherichia coli]|uniref:hypothetical protein n=1 Tax=Escherichia coli TaxID=562 RepID=UPI0020195653|nr:hypothetical protein [Escherichia coli]
MKTNCWKRRPWTSAWVRRASPCTGDVIEICDDDYAVSHRGRVLAVNSQTRTLTLDREITLPSPDHADKPG